MAKYIRFSYFPDIDDIAGIMDQISVGENCPFGFAGGSGGVNNECRVLRLDINRSKILGCSAKNVQLLIGYLGVDVKNGKTGIDAPYEGFLSGIR